MSEAQTQAPVQNMPPPNGDLRLKCGTCRWFVQGFNGQTCQVTRHVKGDTRACIEFQEFKTGPFDKIAQDKFLIEMRRQMLVWRDETIKNFENEIKTYKVFSKKDPLLDAMAYVEQEKLAELAVKFETCQVYTERLLDLRLTIMDKCGELNSFVKDVQSYLYTQYREHAAALKNEAERAAFFRSAAPELFKAQEKMIALQDKTDLVYENLKSAHFAIKGKADTISEIYKARIHSLESRNRFNG